MNKYELGVVVRADLEEETFQAEMARVKGHIERFDGNIDKIDEWGRRKLAYPIKKLTEGVFTFITFTSPAGSPREIENRLRLMENVLRFLIVRKDESDVAVVAPPAAAEVTAEPVAEVVAEPEVVSEPVAEAPEVEASVTDEPVTEVAEPEKTEETSE